jgi:hypothetical protein
MIALGLSRNRQIRQRNAARPIKSCQLVDIGIRVSIASDCRTGQREANDADRSQFRLVLA